MTKTEIKNAPNNTLITKLASTYGVIIARQGSRCKGLDKELNLIMEELKNRDLLTDEDIRYLNF